MAPQAPQAPTDRPPKRRTQADMLLELLREQGTRGVTPLLALDRIRSLRLAAVVFDLKAAGHSITTTMVEVGDGKHVACYVLHEATTRGWEPIELGL